jgi:hypothetical protein
MKHLDSFGSEGLLKKPRYGTCARHPDNCLRLKKRTFANPLKHGKVHSITNHSLRKFTRSCGQNMRCHEHRKPIVGGYKSRSNARLLFASNVRCQTRRKRWSTEALKRKRFGASLERCRIAALNLKVLKIELERSRELMEDCMQSFISSQSKQNEIHHLGARNLTKKRNFDFPADPAHPPKLEPLGELSKICPPVQMRILHIIRDAQQPQMTVQKQIRR